MNDKTMYNNRKLRLEFIASGNNKRDKLTLKERSDLIAWDTKDKLDLLALNDSRQLMYQNNNSYNLLLKIFF